MLGIGILHINSLAYIYIVFTFLQIPLTARTVHLKLQEPKNKEELAREEVDHLKVKVELGEPVT